MVPKRGENIKVGFPFSSRLHLISEGLISVQGHFGLRSEGATSSHLISVAEHFGLTFNKGDKEKNSKSILMVHLTKRV